MRVVLMMLAIVALAAMPAVAQKAQPAGQTAGQASSSRSSAKAAPSAPVNINTATLAQLQTLPGIGPKAAQQILDYRQKNGPFKKPEDLMNVKGIGEKSFLKLKPLLTVTERADKAGL